MSNVVQSLPSGLKEVISETSGLQIRIYYLECLAHASYIIFHENKAFVVDPKRDVDAYVEELANLGATLAGVLETHFHADFVSGHLELQERFNVPIYFGPGAGSRAKFPLHEVQDGEEISLSTRYCFKVRHTPGHTPESVCYVLLDRDNNSKPIKVFTGDTLFIGSCGRPDLVGSLGHTAEQMAADMYESLTSKLMTLPVDVQVFPAHGAGSPCGKNLGSALYSTIGQEMATNPALQFNEKSEFVKFLTQDPQATPHYFTFDVASNIEGAPPLKDDVLRVPRVGPVDFMKHYMKSDDFVVLDTRNAVDFANSFIPKSINCPIGSEGGVIVGPEDGNFSIWVGTMIRQSQKLGLVTPPGREMETLQRLGRIGYSNVVCVLDGGIASWKANGYPAYAFTKLNLEKNCSSLRTMMEAGFQIVDVRTEAEFKENAVKSAVNLPLSHLNSLMDQLDKDLPVVCYCKGGFRSAIAVSLLLKNGFTTQDVSKGFAAISTYCPSCTSTGKVCSSLKEMIDAMK